MHPDAIITGLRRELERLDPKADDYDERKAAIEHEIQGTDKLPRPEVKPRARTRSPIRWPAISPA